MNHKRKLHSRTKLDTKDLTILAEIAEIAGVRPSAVSNWRKRHPSFPSPIANIYSIEIFSLSEVITWLEQTDRLPRT